jgi:GT2 family glycosyltransferase
LLQALESLRRQDYPHFEVVLVDDGSTLPEALTRLDLLEPEFRERGWKVIRQDNRYLGAARNTAARAAAGDYLLFMDDDNIAKPHELSTLVRIAERTGADVVTTLMDFFTHIGANGEPLLESRWLFSGVNSLAVAVARNCFGDANALVRRAAFDAVGGFTEDHGVTHEDWEFFVRIVLHGLKLELVPEALFWYRLDPRSMIRTTPHVANYRRHLRPILEEAPEPYRELIQMAQGLALRDAVGSPATRFSVLAQPLRPLRYELADAINARLKKLWFLHGLGRRLFAGLRRYLVKERNHS